MTQNTPIQAAALAGSDTLMYLDAGSYANGAPMSKAKRLSRAEKQAATRAALLEAAADVFTAVGYGAATVDGITEAAGFSRGAFYSNFESKDELFLTLIESRIEGSLSDITAAFSTGNNLVARIQVGGEFLDALVAKDRQWCLLYMEFWSRAVRDPKLRRRFADQYQLWRAGIAEMIERQSAELEIQLDAPPQELASALIALFEGHVLQRLIDPKAFEAEFFNRLLLRFFASLTSQPSSAEPG
jgi:AcrR family transcriptional regulator